MLQVLEIPYPSADFLECLELPRLEVISLAFQSISKVQLHGFKRPSLSTAPEDTSYISHNGASVFTKLARHMTQLQSASFLLSNLDAAELIKGFEDHLTKEPRILPLLKTIALFECKGITRADCEKLQTLVSRVIVYV
ncbi:hypothetical protein CPB86DRAFT_878494 [Serendipita vermifera]|nr:hypothetical protein CPB86DRAFT_878494 [Serendipita vermifera]